MIEKFDIEEIRNLPNLTAMGRDFVGLADKVNEIVEQLNEKERSKERQFRTEGL